MTMPTQVPGGDGHIDVDELADAAEGLLTPDRQQAVDSHLGGCPDCRATAAALTEVHQLLRDAPPIPMPTEVFARLQAGLEAEQRSRESARARTSGPLTGPGTPSSPDPYSKGPSYDNSKYQPGKHRARSHGTGSQESADSTDQEGDRPGSARSRADAAAKPYLAPAFSERLGRRSGWLRARFAAGAAAAALLATVAGFGGYVVSAASGTAEPSTEPVMIAGNSLKASAAAAQAEGLAAYRFTRAWQCARDATVGMITGIRPTVLDHRNGYLVFLRGDIGTRVVFVSGCDTGDPSAGPTVVLPHR